MLTVTTMKDRIFVPVGWDSVGTAKRAKVYKKKYMTYHAFYIQSEKAIAFSKANKNPIVVSLRPV